MSSKSNTIYFEDVLFTDINSISFSTSKEKIQSFLTDESKIFTANEENIEKAFFPNTTEEIATILHEASKQGIQVTISGAGTGLTGSRVPLKGWIISTEKLRNVRQVSNEKSIPWTERETNFVYSVNLIEKDKSPPLIRVPPGMRLRTLQTLVKSLGYFYPPDTTEWSSFIGGNVATNASGARTFKYGPTRSYVQELRVVLTTGQVLTLKREQMTDNSYSWTLIDKKSSKTVTIHVNKAFPIPNVSKNAVGFPIYDKMPMIELFIGTEGIFGVITEIVLQLIPLPKNIFSLICYFTSPEQMIQFVKRAQTQKEQKIEPIPMSVEYFDYYALQFMMKDHPQIPKNAQAAIYLEQDVEDIEKVDQYLNFWLSILEEVGYLDSWAELDDRGIERHKLFRHSLPVAVNSTVIKNGANKVGTDFAVPSTVFDKFLVMLKKTGADYAEFQDKKKKLTKDDISYVIYGHIGNDHLHMNFLPRDQEELHKAEEMYLDMAKAVVRMGGTLSAEHGVGKKMYGGKHYIWYMIGDKGINELKQLKLKFDPSNILNRGNIFD